MVVCDWYHVVLPPYIEIFVPGVSNSVIIDAYLSSSFSSSSSSLMRIMGDRSCMCNSSSLWLPSYVVVVVVILITPIISIGQHHSEYSHSRYFANSFFAAVTVTATAAFGFFSSSSSSSPSSIPSSSSSIFVTSSSSASASSLAFFPVALLAIVKTLCSFILSLFSFFLMPVDRSIDRLIGGRRL